MSSPAPSPAGPGRAAFVTGAATGIGRATALTLAERGYRVGAFDLDEAGLADLVTEGRTRGHEITVGHLDVTDPEEFVQRLDAFAAAHDGRLDVLVNNAGLLVAGAFEDQPLARHQRLVDVNVNGTLTGMHAAFGHLRSTPGAVVVNLCSASAIYGQPDLASYSATKFAVRGLSEALDLEWAVHDIRVVAIWPLFVQTAMTAGVETGSTRSLGIRLTPQDVATTIADTLDRTTARGRRRTPVHVPVGRQAAVLLSSSRVGPAWVMRAVNKRLSGR